MKGFLVNKYITCTSYLVSVQQMSTWGGNNTSEGEKIFGDGEKESCPYGYKHPPNGMDMLSSILRKKTLPSPVPH
jgi:hypothetical protein